MAQLPEKFTSPCPLPSKFEKELLENLIEECAEVIQRATKAMRFGMDEVQKGQPFNNRDRLSLEVGNLEAMISVCAKERLMNGAMITEGLREKNRKLPLYMQHSRDE